MTQGGQTQAQPGCLAEFEDKYGSSESVSQLEFMGHTTVEEVIKKRSSRN